jgi:hypothetical protein
MISNIVFYTVTAGSGAADKDTTDEGVDSEEQHSSSRPQRSTCSVNLADKIRYDSEFSMPVIWLGRNYLSQIGLVSPNPGPSRVDFTKLKGVRVFHLNIGSRLASKIDQIKDILGKFSTKMIFTMTESGLTKSLPNDTLNIKNYKFARHDKSNRKSLGIITYWTKDINMRSTKVFASEHTSIIFHEFTLGSDRLYLGTIYRLPNATQEHQFSEFLENALDQVVHSDRQILLTGDTNIDLFKQGRKQDDYNTVLASLDMKQHIRTATRNCGTSSTLIDHLITTSSVSIDKIANSNVYISDHHIIGCRLKSFGFKVKPEIVYQQCKRHAPGTGLDFNKCDTRKLSNDLLDADWTVFKNKTEPEDKWDAFHAILSQKISENTALFPCKCGRVLNFNPRKKAGIRIA